MRPSQETQPERHLPYPTGLQELRDNLHLWVLENVGRIDGLYRQSYSQLRSPLETLTASLKVLADLLGNPPR